MEKQQVNKQLICDKQVQNYSISTTTVLGEGQYGQVVLGCETESAKLFAIKIINLKKVFKSKTSTKLVKREISILQSIQSENIVQLQDVIQTSNSLYMCLEYCPDGDLKKYMKKKQNKIPIQQAIGDIKPANLMLKNGVIKISDFGFARCLEGVVEDQNQRLNLTLLGTPQYMSPQILAGEQFSSKCDVWSVGMLVYQIIYGYTPWIGTSPENLLYNIQHQELKFPEEIQIPLPIIDLIKRMLIFEDEKRISWNEVFTHPAIEIKCEQLIQTNSQTSLEPNCDGIQLQDDNNQNSVSKSIDLEGQIDQIQATDYKIGQTKQ